MKRIRETIPALLICETAYSIAGGDNASLEKLRRKVFVVFDDWGSSQWMVEDGYVTEGSSSTAFIITRGGRIVTRPLSHSILPGITRQSLLRLAEDYALTIEERRFTIEEAHGAAEAFLASATSFVLSVVAIDGQMVGDGRPGEMTRRLRQVYLAMACGSAS
jgi:D-alanine transaminase